MIEPAGIAALVATLVLAASVAYVGQFSFLSRHPRSHVLSAASGVTIGYVFLGLLPKLADGHDKLAGKAEGVLPFLEDHVFFVAMLGMLCFYTLALATWVSRRKGATDDASATTFWATIALYGLYVFLLGELLASTAEKDLASMAILAAALAFHFAGSDFGLRESYRDRYVERGRWILAALTMAGCVVGIVATPPSAIVAAMSAFLAGAIIVNVLYDELPDEEEAHLVPFAAGALVCGVLLASIG